MKAFNKLLARPDNGSIPAALEVLLVPRRMVAVTVHTPIGPERGFPVPLGVLSFEPDVVRRAHRYLEAQLPLNMPITGTNELCDMTAVIRWSNESDAGDD